MSDVIERIEAKLDKSAGQDGCWPWLGAKCKKGHPRTSIRKRSANPRRVIWEHVHGEALPKTRQVATNCGTRACLNPAHLYLRPWCDDVARFWTHVEKTEGCWLWTSTLFAHGYASFKMQGLQRHASRVSYEIAYSVDLRDDPRFMCHHCDNPKCVRPDHLFLGSPKDNVDDMWRKGRAASQTKPEVIRAALARGRETGRTRRAGQKGGPDGR